MMEVKNSLYTMTFGPMAPSPSKQLQMQDVKVSVPTAQRIDTFANLITTLHLNGILSERETERSRNRLISLIDRDIKAQKRKG